MTLTLRITGLIGFLLFGLGFALTFLSPIHYEKAARVFLEWKVEEQVRTRLDMVPDEVGQGRIARFAKSMAERNKTEIAALREQLRSGLKDRVATVVGRMQDVSCECRKAMTQAFGIATILQISSLERAEPQLRRVIEGRYGEIVGELLRDLRIFTGTNLLAFALLLGLSFAKPGHIRQLFVPGVLLFIATIAASGFYIFGQNWFFALLYNDYVGLGYAVWLLLIYGFLVDIAVFQASITSRIVEGILHLLGSGLAAGSC